MKNKSNVLFVAAEIAPIAKVGGLADVIGALPQALANIGTFTTVALPYYEFLKSNKQLKAKKCLSFSLEFNGRSEEVAVYQAVLPSAKIPLYLYDRTSQASAEVYGSAEMRGQLYINPLADLERFTFFSVAVAESLERLPVRFEVVHCHDWHTGLVPYLLRNSGRKTLFTIHNLANQGIIDGLLSQWLGKKSEGLPTIDGQFNLMALGLDYATEISTVSPTYAEEIMTKSYGCGLEKKIKSVKNKLSGIVNGIDTKLFNPETDKSIAKRYGFSNISQKKYNKLDLQKKAGLEINNNLPLIGLVSRFVGQKGLDLITEKVVSLPAQFVFLGEGDPVIEQSLLDLAKKHQNFAVIKGFDLKLAQAIYAGADFFLMPSRFEPCGLGQLIALRYGTLPIVCQVGGLKDTVSERNGYGFTTKTDNVLRKTIQRALTDFYAQPLKLEAKKIRAMKGDYSWSKSAKKYQKIYDNLANVKVK